MKRLVSLIAVVLCLFMSVPTVAFGFDLGRGTLTVVVKCAGNLMEGVNIAICRVADAEEVNGEAVYKATNDFKKYSEDYNDNFAWVNDKPEPYYPAQAVKVDTYASGNSIMRVMKETDANGEVSFSGLDPGLYLVSHLNGAGDRYLMAPFLVPVPYKNNEVSAGWSYLVTARPKMKESTTTSSPPPKDNSTPTPPPPTSKGTPTPSPTIASTLTPTPTPGLTLTPTPTLVDIPDDPGVLGAQTGVLEEVDIIDEIPEGSVEGELPQTGVLRWPVPVLSSAGILMFVAGAFMTGKNKKRNEE